MMLKFIAKNCKWVFCINGQPTVVWRKMPLRIKKIFIGNHLTQVRKLWWDDIAMLTKEMERIKHDPPPKVQPYNNEIRRAYR